MIDKASEMLAFGALAKCPACGRGDLTSSDMGYQCSSSRCTFVIEEPLRTPVSIPEDLKTLFDFLMVYDYIPKQPESSTQPR